MAGWQTGDRVLGDPLHRGKGLYGEMMPGGTAEYCLVEAPQLIAIPDGVSYHQAAALPVAYGTAHRMMMTTAYVRLAEYHYIRKEETRFQESLKSM